MTGSWRNTPRAKATRWMSSEATRLKFKIARNLKLRAIFTLQQHLRKIKRPI